MSGLAFIKVLSWNIDGISIGNPPLLLRERFVTPAERVRSLWSVDDTGKPIASGEDQQVSDRS